MLCFDLLSLLADKILKQDNNKKITGVIDVKKHISVSWKIKGHRSVEGGLQPARLKGQ